MDLEIQIQSLISTCVYGMFLSFTYNLLYRFLYTKNKVMLIVNNFIYIILNVLLYFTMLMIINDGVVHIYFLLMTFLGFFIGNLKCKNIRSKVKIKEEAENLNN